MAMKVQVQRRGVLTLPAKLRRQCGIESGDVFQILDLDGIFVLSPTAPMVPLLAAEIEKMRLEAAQDTTDLLQTLREIREQSQP